MGPELRYRSRLGGTWILLMGGLAAALRLAWLGFFAWRQHLFVPGSRWMVFGPLGLATLIGLGLLVMVWQAVGQEVILSRTRFTHRHWGRERTDRWEKVAVALPSEGVRASDRIRVTNGQWSVRLQRTWFGDFDSLARELGERRHAARLREDCLT